MQAIRTDFKPINRITTPLAGSPSFVNSGIIKAVMKNGDRVSVAQIDYQEFDEENFQYVISPYWEIIDGLPASIFQGIAGIDLDLRLRHYYRVNYIPTFIAERTPSENREDLWELLAMAGLDYYDRFEWLLRTDLRSANDNLIVERRRTVKEIRLYSAGIVSDMQYGDKIISESINDLAETTAALNDVMFSIVTNGIDVETKDGRVLVDSATRAAMVPYIITQRIMSFSERKLNREVGIERAKKAGKYSGRKPIKVDENILRQVAKEIDDDLIDVDEAMNRTGIKSRSTFYRKLRMIKG